MPSAVVLALDDFCTNLVSVVAAQEAILLYRGDNKFRFTGLFRVPPNEKS